MAMSNYLEAAILNAVFRNTAFTSPSIVWVALYTTNPTDADTGTEVTGGAYARRQVTFGAVTQVADAGTIRNNINIDFPVATANWGTITHIGVRDAATAGNLLYYGALQTSRTIQSGDQFRILVNQLTLTLS